MDNEQKIPEADVIDDAFLEIIEDLVGDDGDLDAASDVLFEVIELTVDSGQIAEIPESDVSDEEKKSWLEKSLPIIKTEIEKALNDGFNQEEAL